MAHNEDSTMSEKILKRIEEKDYAYIHQAHNDVAKLARALDDVRQSSSGPMRKFCEKVLREVGGEE